MHFSTNWSVRSPTFGKILAQALKSCGTATKVWTDCQALAAPAKFKQSRWGIEGPFPNTGARVPNRA